MQIKFLLSILLFSSLLCTSCTLPWSNDAIPAEHNYTNDYQRHVKAIFDNVDSYLKLYETLLEFMNPSGYDDSTIRVSGIVPNIGSGELSIHANAIRETQLNNKLGAELDIQGFISILDQLAKIDMKGGFVLQSFESDYFHLDRAELSGSGKNYEKIQISWNEFIKTYSPFIGKWIELNLLDIVQYSNQNTIGDYNSITITQAILTAELDILSGGKKLRKILANNSPFGVVGTLGKQGDLYSYNVLLDSTGVLALIDTSMLEYSGTGLSIDQKENIRNGLNMISLSGVLSIHAEQSEYMSFSGILTKSGETQPLGLDIAFLPDDIHMIFSSEGKEDLSFRAKDHGDTSEYMLSASGKILVKGTIQRKSDSIEGVDFFLTPPKEEGLHIIYSNKNKKDFTLKFDKVTQSDNTILLSLVDLTGTIQNKKLTLLSGSISSDETGSSIQLNYTSNTDGSFQGKLHSKELPGDITLDGHIKDDDIIINLSMMGMSSTLTHKNNKDKTFEGSIRFPVATIKWQGKSTKEFYELFSLELTSPVASASLDMKTVDGWLMGPLRIESSQFPTAIPSIDIGAKKNKKDFSLRTDIGMGSGKLEKIHLEWDSHIDVRSDKKAKVKIPIEVLPFSDISTAFSGSQIFLDSLDGTDITSQSFSQF